MIIISKYNFLQILAMIIEMKNFYYKAPVNTLL